MGGCFSGFLAREDANAVFSSIEVDGGGECVMHAGEGSHLAQHIFPVAPARHAVNLLYGYHIRQFPQNGIGNALVAAYAIHASAAPDVVRHDFPLCKRDR